MKFCPKCANVYADTFETCTRDQTALQILPPVKSSKIVRVLFVLGIVAAIVAALILPMHQAERVWKTENHTSAVDSLKQINAAEIQYRITYPERGYSCSLWALGGGVLTVGPPTADAAQLLNRYLAADGVKMGYQFSISGCGKGTGAEKDVFTSYKVTAVPLRLGHTGDKGFCSDQDGVIKVDPKGGTNCTQALQ